MPVARSSMEISLQRFFLAFLALSIILYGLYWKSEFDLVPTFKCAFPCGNNISVNCRTYHYRPSIIFYVHSAPDHFVHRKVIRYTWGHPELASAMGFVTVFMLGSTLNPSLQRSIDREKRTYGDIVQMSFLDSYRNLTYKATGAMRWVLTHCHDYSFVIKTDDDILVNVFGVFDLLRNKSGSQSLLCLVWNGMEIIRNNDSKWFVREDEFPGKVFPRYCSGSAYIFPEGILSAMYNASSSVPFFWVDDVYATGLLAKKAGVSHQTLEKYYSFGDKRQEIVDGKYLFSHLSGQIGISNRLAIWEDIVAKHLDQKLS